MTSTARLVRIDAGDRQSFGIERADLDEDRGLIPVDVLIVELAAAEADDGDERDLDILSDGLRPGSIQSISMSWVKQNSISSTTRSAPMVREIGISRASSGVFGMKW